MSVQDSSSQREVHRAAAPGWWTAAQRIAGVIGRVRGIRLGLQRRVMLYVTLGLVALFGFLSYLGMGAVNRSTDLVFAERLAIAQGVAAAISRDLDHVRRDLGGEMAFIGSGSGQTDLDAAVAEVYSHLTRTDSYALFQVANVAVWSPQGDLLGAAPSRAAATAVPNASATFAGTSRTDVEARLAASGPSDRLTFVVAAIGPYGQLPRAWVVAEAVGQSDSRLFVPFSLLGAGSDSEGESLDGAAPQSQYRLEVATSEGITALRRGPHSAVGATSPHAAVIEDLLTGQGEFIFIHRVSEEAPGARDHVTAVARVPATDLFLFLEQGSDVALAVPATFRRQIILFGGLGLALALIGAWATTYRVVRPTELLTRAAVRMARGELSTPIDVHAQDEIAVLAENLEAMRRQLLEAAQKVEGARRDLEVRVEERTQQLHELLQRAFGAQEEERRRVALELHDQTAQELTVLSFALDAVIRRADALPPSAAASLREARRTAAGIMEGLRRLIFALRPVALADVGLVALRLYAEEFLEPSGVAVHLEVEGQERRLPDDVELALYRIGQEALTNVARHARARNVWARIAYNDSLVVLAVRDDGVGFDPDAREGTPPRTRGLGLAGMRERVSLIGGHLTIESAPGRGTSVEVRVPGV